MQVLKPVYSIEGVAPSDVAKADGGEIALADLVSLYNVLESASAAMARGHALKTDGGEMLSTLVREEQAFVEMRLSDVAEEIRRASPNSLSDRIQKLRFNLVASGDDEIAAEAAIAEFCATAPEKMTVLTDETRECIDKVCEELSLAEAAVDLMCRAHPKFEGVRILIERSVMRLSELNAD